MLRTSLIALAALGLTACATSEEQSTAANNSDCFFAQQVSSYEVVDDHSIQVRVGSRSYLLRTAWNARDLDWTQAIALRARATTICTGNGLGVEIIGGDPQRNYPVSSIERLPDDAPTGS